jgi:two-component system, LytTR family, response regulator
MPGKDGFEVIEEIGPVNMPITVFVTAHNEHAVNAFEVHALDYLVKPIERKRLERTLARVKERVQLEEMFAAREQISSAVEALRQAAFQPEHPQRFLTRNGNTASVVSVSEIEWIEAADYYVCLHAAGKRHMLRESIRALETKLDPKKFIRLHRSAIVNLDHVREIHRDGQAEGWVLLSTGARVRLNRNGWRKLIGATGASSASVL